jgi:hypothetical protein
VVFAWAGSASAQEVFVQSDRGAHYVGEPFEIRVVAKDFEEEPAPEVTIGDHEDGSFRLLGVSPSSSTSITIVNGKISRVREVSVSYRYEFSATREGRVRIPEFIVTQGTTTRRTKSFEVEITGVPTSQAFEIAIELPEGPIFVGQKVPIAVEFRIDRGAQENLVGYQVRVPLFDDPTLRFLDVPPPRTDTQLEIDTEAGTIRLPAMSSEKKVGGRTMLVVRAERTMIPLVSEALRAEPPVAFISQGTRFRRDLFNQRQATSVERSMASGKPIRIDVVEVPRRGRPPSFAGAVGSGFSLEVDADRSVVQLGEPIQLTFHLRGNGDLSSAGLPALDAEGPFDPEAFRIPTDPPSGLVDEDGKHFEVTLRVLDSDVREIPALAYSWFDADSMRFETTHSRPIALSVGAAEIIGADAVTRRADNGERKSQAATRPAEERTPDGSARSSTMALTGANLAVERDVTTLLRDQRGSGHDRPMTLALYGAGLAFVFFAIFDQRRRAVDPISAGRREAWRRTEKSVQAALERPKSEAATALGRALRELVAALPEEADAEFDALIAECDALRFAPASSTSERSGDGASGLPTALVERARRFVADRSRAAKQKAGGA